MTLQIFRSIAGGARTKTRRTIMRHIYNQQQFSSLAPSAPGIFAYIAKHLLLRKMALEFQYAVIVDEGGARAVAKFCSKGRSFSPGAVVWVSAIGDIDGCWRFSHSIGSVS